MVLVCQQNIQRFPSDFEFQLTREELNDWKSQFATSNKEFIGLRKMPYVFTEQGVSMLSSVLKSKTAIDMSIRIIKSFIGMKKFLSLNASIFQRLENIETQQLKYRLESDEKFDKIFEAIESKEIQPKQGIFYNGQVFDAYHFVSDLIREAKSSIVLIDNFVDDSVLTLFSKNKNIDVVIYTNTLRKNSD